MPASLSTGPRWYVISLRPRGGHAALRAAARRGGHGFLALSVIEVVPRRDPATREALADALGAACTVFTSPAAVRAAQALAPLGTLSRAFAVGAGTARALRRAGVARVEHPARMDSDGLLALEGLVEVAGRRVGLVTAPGGRDAIAPALAARGAEVLRAEVYERRPCALTEHSRRRLAALSGRIALALSSREALEALDAQLDDDERARLRGARVVAASARLASAAHALGFAEVVVAEGPRPAQLVAALSPHATPVPGHRSER